jgi:hypothetical protein
MQKCRMLRQSMALTQAVDESAGRKGGDKDPVQLPAPNQPEAYNCMIRSSTLPDDGSDHFKSDNTNCGT